MTQPQTVEQRIEYGEVDKATNQSIFINGPAEFLVKVVVEELRKVKEFAALFGATDCDPGYIDDYRRMDYPVRALPALRIYNELYNKDFDSWFIEGDILADIIWPANIRRTGLEQIPDTVGSALLQQFRRPTFFHIISERMGKPLNEPGFGVLNELGKRFSVDKALGFEWQDEIVPLTQIRINFKIDLRQWDLNLEEENRTKDDPFEYTLGNLERIVTVIQGIRTVEEVDDPEIEITADQKTKI